MPQVPVTIPGFATTYALCSVLVLGIIMIAAYLALPSSIYMYSGSHTIRLHNTYYAHV